MAKPAAKIEVTAAPGKVLRFGVASRLAHWSHALTFCVLFITGLGLVFRGVVGVATLRTFGDIHLLMAWPFTFLAAVILVLGARKAAAAWLSSAVRFDADDRKFLKLFPQEFFGRHVQMPAQGKFNGGEKINSLLQVTGWLIMVVTGWLMVYKAELPEVFRWALPIHSFTALVLGSVALGHIYMAVGLPGSRQALSGMFSGMVPRSWARGHHKKWADELKD